jgi:hypothetical protein
MLVVIWGYRAVEWYVDLIRRPLRRSELERSICFFGLRVMPTKHLYFFSVFSVVASFSIGSTDVDDDANIKNA